MGHIQYMLCGSESFIGPQNAKTAPVNLLLHNMGIIYNFPAWRLREILSYAFSNNNDAALGL